MSLNLNKLSKAEILKLWNSRCQHGHRYLNHYNCYLKEKGITEKIGFLDIETSNLKPAFGIVFCWCIKDRDTGVVHYDTVTKKDLYSKAEDRRVVETCIATMKNYDRVVTHYGTYFDLPFLRTKAIIHGLEFPKYKEIYHTDVYAMAKKLVCMHSYRQNIIAETLFNETIKTRINHSYWRKAMQGSKSAMEYILDHCIKDVDELQNNYEALIEYTNSVKRSI